VSWTTIICNIALAWIWVCTYLAAAYTTTLQMGLLRLWYPLLADPSMSTLNESREEVARRGIARDYILLAAWPNVLWVSCPVAFGLTDGGNVVGVTGGAIFFGGA
jgi:bacteriorhodopsin